MNAAIRLLKQIYSAVAIAAIGWAIFSLLVVVCFPIGKKEEITTGIISQYLESSVNGIRGSHALVLL